MTSHNTDIQYSVPKHSVRFVAGTAALDTVFLLRPLDESADAFRDLFNGYGSLDSTTYNYWWVHPWDAEHDDDEEEFVTREQWDTMYACAKAVGLEDGVGVLVDVTW